MSLAQRGSPEIRQASTPLRDGMPDADTVPGLAIRAHVDSVGRAVDGWVRGMSAPTSAANSSAVGVPRTTRNTGSRSGM